MARGSAAVGSGARRQVLADGSGVWFQRRVPPAAGTGAGSRPARPALVASVLVARPRDGGEGFELHHCHVVGGRAVQVSAAAAAAAAAAPPASTRLYCSLC